MTKEKSFVYSCLLFTLVSEMLLSPFYPQLFSQYFRVDGVEATSLFIVCCRLVVIVMTPLWAVASRKWGFKRLVTGALVVMAGCKLLLPSVDTFTQFLAVSLLLLFFQSIIYLLYPTIVASSRSDQEKVRATTTYLFVFHGSVIVSGIVGSFLISHPLPLDIYYLFACIDLLLAVVSCFIIWHQPSPSEEKGKRAVLYKEGKRQGEFFIYLFVVFFFYIGHHTIRPYFTAFLEADYTVSEQEMSLLYVMPSLTAVVLQFMMPKRILHSHVKGLLIGLTVVTAGLLLVQAAVESYLVFVIIRIAYSLCFFISLAAMDIFFFRSGIGERSPLLYSVVSSVQNAALLFAPTAAFLAIQSSSMKGPFLLGGFLLIGAAVCMCLLFIKSLTPVYQLRKGVNRREYL
ncbi:MFS transporter [Bacillus thermotolerans]|uniref:MFS transporter n=1 Tax=Bacillus thermotolerans TaxID=1221996 RepID=UPI00057C5B1B|nr:MFS transporter [Bacillus thermotolerans]KKB38624.1 Siderophore related permease [Bacillus thermotolerans]